MNRIILALTALITSLSALGGSATEAEARNKYVCPYYNECWAPGYARPGYPYPSHSWEHYHRRVQVLPPRPPMYIVPGGVYHAQPPVVIVKRPKCFFGICFRN